MYKCFKNTLIFLIIIFLVSFLFNINHNISPLIENNYYLFTLTVIVLYIMYTAIFCQLFIKILNFIDNSIKDINKKKEIESFFYKNILLFLITTSVSIFILPTVFYASDIFIAISSKDYFFTVFLKIILTFFYLEIIIFTIIKIMIAICYSEVLLENNNKDKK